mmetsp:Transcript_58557/g.174362  ORF Transcript_58557/g.174362 Transcript_58557/m.174362 type:complete len:214 (+) Transcript_58557:2821-3462(+)
MPRSGLPSLSGPSPPPPECSWWTSSPASPSTWTRQSRRHAGRTAADGTFPSFLVRIVPASGGEPHGGGRSERRVLGRRRRRRHYQPLLQQWQQQGTARPHLPRDRRPGLHVPSPSPVLSLPRPALVAHFPGLSSFPPAGPPCPPSPRPPPPCQVRVPPGPCPSRLHRTPTPRPSASRQPARHGAWRAPCSETSRMRRGPNRARRGQKAPARQQ